MQVGVACLAPAVNSMFLSSCRRVVKRQTNAFIRYPVFSSSPLLAALTDVTHLVPSFLWRLAACFPSERGLPRMRSVSLFYLSTAGYRSIDPRSPSAAVRKPRATSCYHIALDRLRRPYVALHRRIPHSSND